MLTQSFHRPTCQFLLGCSRFKSSFYGFNVVWHLQSRDWTSRHPILKICFLHKMLLKPCNIPILCSPGMTQGWHNMEDTPPSPSADCSWLFPDRERPGESSPHGGVRWPRPLRGAASKKSPAAAPSRNGAWRARRAWAASTDVANDVISCLGQVRWDVARRMILERLTDVVERCFCSHPES